MPFQYIAIEGPIGVGKTSLAERLATRLDAVTILEETENPFLADFYSSRPGSALQAQLFYLLNRHRQQISIRQGDLFTQSTVSDYLFDKDKIFAYLNLDDNELFIYQRLFDLLMRDVAAPDLVIYLQAPTDVLARRLRDRISKSDGDALEPSQEYLQGAQRGLSALLLPLFGDTVARRGDLTARSRWQRRRPRRSDPSDQHHGPGDAVLRPAHLSYSSCKMQNAECKGLFAVGPPHAF